MGDWVVWPLRKMLTLGDIGWYVGETPDIGSNIINLRSSQGDLNPISTNQFIKSVDAECVCFSKPWYSTVAQLKTPGGLPPCSDRKRREREREQNHVSMNRIYDISNNIYIMYIYIYVYTSIIFIYHIYIYILIILYKMYITCTYHTYIYIYIICKYHIHIIYI